MKFPRILAAFAALGLAACEQAQMHGPVGGAMVSVTELRSGAVIVSGETTDNEDSAQAVAASLRFDWATINAVQKSWFIGNHRFTDNSVLDDDTWYVLEMEGGFDYYADGNFLKAPMPVQVFGSVHALATGARLKQSTFLVTPVTEAAYQYVKDFANLLTDEELAAALDQAAADLVGDVEEDGDVDYEDVLLWNRLFHTAKLQAGIVTGLAALTDAVSAGDAGVDALADALFSANSPAGVAEVVYADSISDIIVEKACGPGCHVAPGTATQGPFSSDNIILPPGNPDHVDFNTENFRMLVQSKGIGHVLTKVSGGDGHIGGVRLPAGSADYNTFEDWLNLL